MELADAEIFAGIRGGLGSSESQAGDITLNATETIRVRPSSFILNRVEPNETGNGGNVNITTGSLFVRSSLLGALTLGKGRAGNVAINARFARVFQ